MRRLWKRYFVERALFYRLDKAALEQSFEPGTRPTGPSVHDYELRIQELMQKEKRALQFLLENKDHEDDPVFEERIRELRAEIVAAERKRDAAAKAEMTRIDLPTTKSSWSAAGAFAQRLENARDEELIRLRRMIIQQLRTALAEVRFSNYSIEVVVELPGKPTEESYPFGPISWIRSIESKIEDDVERYFMCDKIYTEDPEYAARMGKAPYKPGSGSYPHPFT
jgi:hypothetical protein